MAFAPVEYAKEHPVQSVAIGGVIILAAYLFMSGGSSNSTATSSGVSDAQLAAAQQQATLDAGLTQQSNAIQGQIAISSQNNAASITLAQLQAQTAIVETSLQAHSADTQSQYAYDLGMAQTAAGEMVNLTNINAQYEATRAGIAAQVETQRLIENASMYNTGTMASVQINMAALNAQTAQVISANQTQGLIAQTNAMVSIAKSSGGNSMGSIIGAVGGIVAALL